MRIRLQVSSLGLLFLASQCCLLDFAESPFNLVQASPTVVPKYQKGEQTKTQSETQKANPPRPEFGVPRSTSIAPFLLAQRINRVKAKWEKHRILEDLDLQPIWGSLGIPSGNMLRCESNACHAQIFPIALTGQRGKELLLKLTLSYQFCRYLIFTTQGVSSPSDMSSRFLGYIDHDFNRGEMSSHRAITIGEKRFLLVKGQTGSGTGFWSYDETLYEVSDGGIREVLKYTSYVHQAGWPQGLGWELKSSIVPNKAKASSVIITFSESFAGLNYIIGDFPFLFSQRRSVCFTWSASEKRFAIDTSTPATSRQWWESMAVPDGWSDESFIKNNLPRFLAIARKGTERQRSWLREFLSHYPDSPEKTTLLQATRTVRGSRRPTPP